MQTSAYGLDSLTPRTHAVNRVRQQEHKEQKDVEKATRKRHEERRKTHNLVWVQWEKEGLSLPTTPENTDNNIDGGVVWSGLEEESEDEVPLAVGTKGKDVVLARAAAASVAGAASAGEGTAMVGVPSTGGAPSVQASKKHKRQVSTRR
jgi:hypothetical protein